MLARWHAVGSVDAPVFVFDVQRTVHRIVLRPHDVTRFVVFPSVSFHCAITLRKINASHMMGVKFKSQLPSMIMKSPTLNMVEPRSQTSASGFSLESGTMTQ